MKEYSSTRASPSDDLVSYPGHTFEEGLIPLHSVYSTASANRADWDGKDSGLRNELTADQETT